MPDLAVNSTTLAYEDTGPRDGIPLVFSHSLFFDRTMFAPLVAALPDTYRVVTYDHRGQGGSAPAPLEQLGIDTLAEDAASLIESLELGPCHVLGNSMGGFVALRLAARRPDLLRSAVALGSSAEEEHQLPAFAPLVEALREQGPAPHIETLLHIMFGDTSLRQQTPAVARWRAFMLTLPTRIAGAAYQVIHRASVVAELASTTVPVLAIAGEQDHAYPPPISSEHIADAVKDGRHVLVADAGHSVALEQPTVVAAHLLQHFARVER